MENGNTDNKHKILLADDSVTIRKVIELTFEDEGIEVVSVADGDAAMQKFVENRPDLVIADVNMPGMSGYQICEMIKQDETTRDIPVILLVGSFEPFDAGEAVRVGSNFYFTKPFQSIRELINKVKEYLEVGSFGRTIAETNDIEDLYQQSIIETPETEPGSEFEAIVEEDESEVVEGPHIVESGAAEPEPDICDEVEVPDEQLGDAGMDDEMIETVHVSQPAVSETVGYSADPFATPAIIEDEKKPDLSAEETWENEETQSGADEASGGKADEAVAAQPLRLAIVDEEPSAVPEAATPAEDQEAAGNASVELIELIVKKVIERMSDTAVREAAQEAVPRIAEKLIREALEAEKK